MANNPYIIPIAIIAAGLMISLGIYFGLSATGQSALPLGNAGTTIITDANDITDDDPVLGLASAPLTIVEFSDYQCPFCRSFWQNTLPDLKKDYIDTGKVKLVYRDFPLNFHPMAQTYAEAAECAGDQGKYFEMHDKIFEEQAAFGTGTISALDEGDVKTWASDIGLNTATFNQCLDSGKYTAEVQDDLSDGTDIGITGTPSFIVGDTLLVGAQPYSAFKQIIDSQL
jgi:protein-disulfide isomerase